jgi:hypothetical protein
MNTTARRSLRAALRVFLCSAVFGCSSLPAIHSCAALLTLIDDNSSADFDTATPSNNYNWFVDATDLLAQQAFWYRVGPAGPENSVHTLPIGVQGTSDANFDGNPDTLFVRYNGAGFRIETRYTLDGGTPGSGNSDMGEQISIINLTPSPLDFHFYQYADFDLSAVDTVLFTNANAVDQTGGGLRLAETVVTPVPSHREAAFFPITLNKLNDALPTTLSDNAGAGPGDVTWAFQWDVIIPPSGSYQISKDKNIIRVPEPGLTSLIGLVAGLLLTQRRTRGAFWTH